MAKKEEKFDVDKEIERISRKTRANTMKSEMSFDNRLSQLEHDIDKTLKSKEKLFDESVELRSEYVTTDFTDSSIEKYRKILNKM